MSSKKLKITSLATTNLQLVQQISGNVRGLLAYNTNAAARFVKFFDKVDAVTLGTDVPVLTLQVPATGQTIFLPTDGINFKNSIWLAMTVNAVDNDVAAVGAGDLIVTVLYE